MSLTTNRTSVRFYIINEIEFVLNISLLLLQVL